MKGLCVTLIMSLLMFWRKLMCRMYTSENLLVSIQDKIKWADNMSEMDKKHRKEVEEGVEEVKKSLSMKVSETCDGFRRPRGLFPTKYIM